MYLLVLMRAFEIIVVKVPADLSPFASAVVLHTLQSVELQIVARGVGRVDGRLEPVGGGDVDHPVVVAKIQILEEVTSSCLELNGECSATHWLYRQLTLAYFDFIKYGSFELPGRL